MVIFHSYVKLPEGNPCQLHPWPMFLHCFSLIPHHRSTAEPHGAGKGIEGLVLRSGAPSQVDVPPQGASQPAASVDSDWLIGNQNTKRRATSKWDKLGF